MDIYYSPVPALKSGHLLISANKYFLNIVTILVSFQKEL